MRAKCANLQMCGDIICDLRVKVDGMEGVSDNMYLLLWVPSSLCSTLNVHTLEKSPYAWESLPALIDLLFLWLPVGFSSLENTRVREDWSRNICFLTPSLPCLHGLLPLLKAQLLLRIQLNPGPSILFHWFVYPLLCQCHTALITVAL